MPAVRACALPCTCKVAFAIFETRPALLRPCDLGLDVRAGLHHEGLRGDKNCPVQFCEVACCKWMRDTMSSPGPRGANPRSVYSTIKCTSEAASWYALSGR